MNKSEDVLVTVDAASTPAFLNAQLLSSVRVMQDEEALERRLQQVEAEGASRVRRIALPQDRAAFLQFVREWEQKHRRAVGMGTVAMLVLPLAACGGGGGGGGGTVPTDSGWVIDGYVTGATVSRADSSGSPVTTDGTGRFTGLAGSGVMQSVGGIDVSTGEAINFTMRAPDNATVISPLTTLVQALIDGGMTEATANTTVVNALGLTAGTNLLTTDPWANTAANLNLIQEGAKVANILTIGVAEGAASTTLASKIAAALVPGVDLTDAAVIQGIYTAAGLTTSVDTLAQTAAKENIAVDAATSATAVADAQKLPTVTIALSDTVLKVGETATVTFTFSEKVTGFTLDDVSVVGGKGTLSDFKEIVGSNGLMYQATFTPIENLDSTTDVIHVGTEWTDQATTPNSPAAATDSASFTIDTVKPLAPVVSLFEDTGVVDGVTHNGQWLISGIEADATVEYKIDSGTWVSWDGQSALPDLADKEGVRTVEVRQTDVAGNQSDVGSLTFTVDTIPATLTITLDDAALIVGETSLVTFKFSDAPLNFSAADITVNSSSVELADLTQDLTQDPTDPTRYTAALRVTQNVADADSKIEVGTSWTDAAGNAPAAITESANYTVTKASPLVVNKLVPTGANTFNTLAEALAVSQPGDLLKIAGGAVVTAQEHSAKLATLGSITLDTGTSLTLSAAQADSIPSIAASGTANVVLTGLDNVARDLSTVTVENGQFSTVLGTSVTLDPATQLGALTIGVQSGATLTLSAAQAAARAISGQGGVEITALDLAPAANLSTLTVNTAHAAVSESLTFTGSLGKVALTVASGKVLTTTAAIADGKTIDGLGTVDITALQTTPAADLSKLTASDVNAAVTTAFGTPVVFTGKLGNADVSISGTGELQLAASATLGITASFDVALGSTLTASAAQISGKAVTGAGAVTVTELAADSNLSGMVSGLTVTAIITDATDISSFTNLANVDRYTLQAGTLTLLASQADGKQIDGTGTVNVTGLNADTDLSGIADTTTLNVTVSSSVDVSGNTHPAAIDSITVSAGTLTLSADQADGLPISGAGTVAVVGVQNSLAADLSSISVTGGISAAVLTTGTSTFTGSFGSASVTVSSGTLVLASAADFSSASFQVASGATLQAAAADLLGVSISGSGNVVVDNLIATSDLSSIASTTNLTANVASSIDLSLNTNLAAVDSYVVASGQTLTLTAAQASGKSITGLGSVVITDVDATPAADLDGVSATGGVSIVVDANTAFEGTLADNAAFTVEAGTQLTLDASLADARTISGLGELKLITAAGSDIANTDLSGLSTASVDLTSAALGSRTALTLNETSQFVVTPAQTGALTITGTAGKNLLIVDVSALNFGTVGSPVEQLVTVKAETLGGDDTVTFRFGGVPGEDWRTVKLTADSYLRFGDGIDTLEISNGTLDMSLPDPANIDFDGLAINSVLNVSGNLLQYLLNKLGASTAGLSGGGTINVTSAPTSGVIDLDKFGTFTAGGVTPPTIVFPANFVDGNNDPVFFNFTPPVSGGVTVNIQVGSTLWYDGSAYLSKDLTVFTAQQLLDAVARDDLDGDSVDSITLGKNVTLDGTLNLSDNSTLRLETAADKQLLLGSTGKITLSVSQANGAEIAGLGLVDIVVGSGVTSLNGVDLSGITSASQLTVQGLLDVSADNLGKFKLVVASGGALSLSYAQATLRTITGDGALTIKAVDPLGSASADFSKLASSLNVTAVIDKDVTFDGNLGNVDQLQVLAGNTLTSSAAILGGRTITGAGNVAVTALGISTDLSKIAVTGIKTATVSSNLTFTGNLGDFDVVIASLRTLTTAASKLDGVDVSGAGRVVVSLDKADADLDGLVNTGSKTAYVETNQSFTGTLANGFNVIVGINKTLTTNTTALNLANVTVSGDGNVTLTAIGANSDLTRISVTGSKLVNVSTDADYTAAKLGSFALNLTAADVDLTLTAAQANARTITGDGNLTVVGLESSTKLNRIDVGQVKVQVNDSVVFNGDLGNTSEVTLQVASGKTLTSAASILDGAAITGAGNVVVTGLDDDLIANLSRIEVTGTKVIQFDGLVELASNFVLPQGFSIQLVGGGELIATAQQLNGVSVTGDGNVIVTGLGATSDLDGITVSGMKLAEVSADVSFSGTLSPGFQLVVDAGKTLKIASDALDGVVVFGEGNVTLTGIAAGVDLSQVLVSGTRAIEVTGTTVDLTAVDLGDFVLRLADGVELTLTANQMLGRSVQLINDDGVNQASLKIIGLGAQTLQSLGATVDNDIELLTQAPKVTINTPIAVDGVINGAESAAGITVSGTATNADGQVLKLDIAGTELSALVANGTWSVTVPATVLRGLADASYTLSAKVTAADGSTGSSPVVNFSIDTVAPSLQINPITADNILIGAEVQNGFSISGSTSGVETGQPVTVSLNGKSYQGVVQNGVWSVTVPAADATALVDGILPVSANVKDAAGNPAATASHAVTVALNAPAISIDPVAVDNIINLVESTAALTISGSTANVAAGSAVTVSFNGKTYSAIVADNSWTVQVPAADLVSLTNGFSHAVNATVLDAVGNAVSASVPVLMDVMAPTIASLNETSLAENQSPLYTAQATDGQGGSGAVRYSLAASGDHALLAIDPVSGVVTLVQGNPDRETKSSYSFTVVATDAAGNAASKSVTVNVSDVDEFDVTTPTDSNAAANSVQENATAGTVVDVTASAFDADVTTNTITYSLVANATGAAYTAGEFAIGASSGVVTVAGAIDREAGATRTIYVKALSADGSSSIQSFTIDVGDLNDNGPVFTSTASGTVAENVATSTAIYTAVAPDADATAANNTVSYSLKSGLSDDAGLLNIDAASGAVTLQTSANYEQKSSYSFTVVATDNGNPARSAEKAVTVSVSDVNEAGLLNAAQDATQMGAALLQYAVQMGFDLTAFNALPSTAKAGVALDLLASRPLAGYSNEHVAEGVFDGIVGMYQSVGATVMTANLMTASTPLGTLLAAVNATVNAFKAASAVGATTVGGESLATAILSGDAAINSFGALSPVGQQAFVDAIVAGKPVTGYTGFSALLVQSQIAYQLGVAADTVAPVLTFTADTGISASDGITANGEVKVTNLLPNATWKYSLDGGVTWKVGSGSFTVPEGVYAAGKVVVQQTNGVGTPSQIGQLGAVTVDLTDPATPTISSETVGVAQIELNLVADAGSLVEFRVGGVVVGSETLTTAVSGARTFNVTLQGGNNEVSVTVTDLAGNVSDAATKTVFFDPVTPALAAAESAQDVLNALALPAAVGVGYPVGEGSAFAQLSDARQLSVANDLLANGNESHDTASEVIALFDAVMSVRSAMYASLDAINAADSADDITVQTIFTDVLKAVKDAVAANVGLTTIGGQEVSDLVTQGNLAVANYNALSDADELAFRTALVTKDYGSITELLLEAQDLYAGFVQLDLDALAAVNAASTGAEAGVALNTYAARFGIDVSQTSDFAALEPGRQQGVFADVLANRANTVFANSYDTLAQVKALFDVDVTVRTVMEASLNAINAATTVDQINTQTIFTDVLDAVNAAVTANVGLTLIGGQLVSTLITQGNQAVLNYSALSPNDQVAFRDALIKEDFGSITELLNFAVETWTYLDGLDDAALAAVNAASTATEAGVALQDFAARFGIDVSQTSAFAALESARQQGVFADVLANRVNTPFSGSYDTLAQVKALFNADVSVRTAMEASLDAINAATQPDQISSQTIFTNVLDAVNAAVTANVGRTTISGYSLATLQAQGDLAVANYTALTANDQLAFRTALVTDPNFSSVTGLLERAQELYGNFVQLDLQALAAVNAGAVDTPNEMLATLAAVDDRLGLDVTAMQQLPGGLQVTGQLAADLLVNRPALGGYTSIAQVKSLLGASQSIITEVADSLTLVNAATTANPLTGIGFFTDAVATFQAAATAGMTSIATGSGPVPLNTLIAQAGAAQQLFSSLTGAQQTAFLLDVSDTDYTSFSALLSAVQAAIAAVPMNVVTSEPAGDVLTVTSSGDTTIELVSLTGNEAQIALYVDSTFGGIENADITLSFGAGNVTEVAITGKPTVSAYAEGSDAALLATEGTFSLSYFDSATFSPASGAPFFVFKLTLADPTKAFDIQVLPDPLGSKDYTDGVPDVVATFDPTNAASQLDGTASRDLLIASAGPVEATGGLGADVFAPASINTELTITDFSGSAAGGQGDKVDLGLLMKSLGYTALATSPTDFGTGELAVWEDMVNAPPTLVDNLAKIDGWTHADGVGTLTLSADTNAAFGVTSTDTLTIHFLTQDSTFNMDDLVLNLV